MAKTLDQQRAAFAWECATAGMHAPFSKEYRVLEKGAPALIMTSGLMPTLAFYNGKKEKAHHTLLDDVTRWLASQIWKQNLNVGRGAGTFVAFMGGLYDTDSETYRRATDEALEILKWIRQFVDAV